MTATVEDIITEFARQSAYELKTFVQKIRNCLKQLTDNQLWWRLSPPMRSIANLLLHLCGSTRQWIVSGKGGVQNTRDNQRKSDERGSIPAEVLIERLDNVVAEERCVLM